MSARLKQVAADVDRSGLHLVVVEGPPGIGKSHLVRWFSEDQQTAYQTVTVAWREQSETPGAPLVRLGIRLLGAEANGALPWNEAPPMDAVNAEIVATSRVARHRAVASALSDRLMAGHTLIVLEDIQWADELSCEVVESLVEQLLDEPVRFSTILLLTMRTGLRASRGADLIERLTRSPRCYRFTLGPLSPLDEYALVCEELGRSATPAVADAIRRSARGVPLDVRAAATVQRSRDEGRPGGRSSDPPSAVDESQTLTRWIGVLGVPAGRALGAVALWGETVDVDALVDAAGVDATEAVAVIDRAAAVGILERTAAGHQFAHDRVRLALMRTLPTLQQAAIHRRAMDRAAASIDPVLRASHCTSAGALVRPGERLAVFEAAARACEERGAWSDAADLLESALDAALVSGADETTQASLRSRAGFAHFCNHDVAAAALRLGELLAAPETAVPSSTRAAAAMTLYRVMITGLRSALRTPPDDSALMSVVATSPVPAERALALGLLAEGLAASGRTDAALVTADRAVREAQRSGASHAMGRAWFALGLARATQLDHGGSRAAYREALVHADAAGDDIIAGAVDARLPIVLLSEFRLAESAVAAQRGLARARRDANYINQSLAHASQSSVSLLQGALDRAVDLARQSLRAAERSSYPAAHLLALVPACMALRLAERDAEAREVEDEWGPRTAGFGPFLGALRAQSADGTHTGGSADHRRVHALATPIALARTAAAAEVAVALADPASLGELLPKLAQLDERGQVCTPYWPVLITRVLGETQLAVGDTEAGVATLRRALRVAERQHAALEVARCSLALGRVLLSGEASEAEGVTRCAAALDLAERLGLPLYARLAASELRLHRTYVSAVPGGDPEWRVLLMVDLADSTALSMRSGDRAYAHAVGALRGIVRAEVRAREGSVVDEAGDGVLASFTNVGDAEACAVAVHARIVLTAVHVEGLAARIALVGGRPYLHEGRPVGSLVNLTARLCASANPGQIVVDESVAATSAGVGRYEPIRPLQLKGVPGDVQAYALAPA